MNSYTGSEEHKKNALKAAQKAQEYHKEQRKKRIEKYNLSPAKCAHCSGVLDYERRKNKYCSKSCSATHTQIGKKHSKETKKKIRNSYLMFLETEEGRQRKKMSSEVMSKLNTKRGGGIVCKIHIKECVSCKELFIAANAKKNYERKTCSKLCNIEASVGKRTYQNGSRKPSWYDNPWQGRVLLDSTWEVRVADLLCEIGIEWSRPRPIPWRDTKSRIRYYFPDFYLPHYNVYLDPKNEYCMQKDKEKMQAVEQDIEIEYGHVDEIVKYIKTLEVL